MKAGTDITYRRFFFLARCFLTGSASRPGGLAKTVFGTKISAGAAAKLETVAPAGSSTGSGGMPMAARTCDL